MTYAYKLFSQTSRHPKIVKAEKEVGVHMRVLHLAPARSSGVANLCPMASKGCEAACLNWAGFQYSRKQDARVAKTKFFFEDRNRFVYALAKEIFDTMEYAYERGMIPGIRLNGTSDIRWERIPVNLPSGARYENLMDMFPDVCFMDYTKIANRRNLPPNYRLTFSRSESNDEDCVKAIENGMNVAVVFSDNLPSRWNVMHHHNVKVIDGDVHDWRYADYDDYHERVVVGLLAKGRKGREDRTGFVIRH